MPNQNNRLICDNYIMISQGGGGKSDPRKLPVGCHLELLRLTRLSTLLSLVGCHLELLRLSTLLNLVGCHHDLVSFTGYDINFAPDFILSLTRYCFFFRFNRVT